MRTDCKSSRDGGSDADAGWLLEEEGLYTICGVVDNFPLVGSVISMALLGEDLLDERKLLVGLL